jgi:hypothetical protein
MRIAIPQLRKLMLADIEKSDDASTTAILTCHNVRQALKPTTLYDILLGKLVCRDAF